MNCNYEYPCVSASSAQSAFYYIPPVFCIHPRLIFLSLSDRIRKIKFELFRKLSIIFQFENHREHRVHREKWQSSVLSVYSVVDYLTKNSFFLKGQIHSCLNSSKNKPQIMAPRVTPLEGVSIVSASEIITYYFEKIQF